MTELEQLKADLATLEKANNIAARDHGYSPIFLDELIRQRRAKIAALEAQQAPVDEWEEAKETLAVWFPFLQLESPGMKRLAQYIRHLESKVAELEEDINTSEFTWMATHAARLLKERDDALAKVTELENELRCERIAGGKVRDDRKAISAEQNRQELAKLTTILNAIPPACGLARELVERRIESVKREMQGNG